MFVLVATLQGPLNTKVSLKTTYVGLQCQTDLQSEKKLFCCFLWEGS